MITDLRNVRSGLPPVLLGIFLLSLLFSGCRVVGPDYGGVPVPPLQANYQASSNLQDVSLADPVAFWSSFSDSILDQLVAQSLAKNLTVQQAAERIIESRAQLRLAGGQLLPAVQGGSEYAFSKQSLNAFPFVASNSRPFSLFRNGMDASWEIDLFGRIERGIEASEAELESHEARLTDIQQTLTADVATCYFTIRLLQQRLVSLETNLQRQRGIEVTVQELIEAGDVTDLDGEQTTALIHRTLAQQASVKQRLDLEFNRLSLLLGEAPSPELQVFVGFGQVPEPSLAPLAGLPTDLLRRRPDIRQAESVVRAACARIGIAEADLYPSLSLTGSISVSAQDLTRLYQSESLALGVGPAVRWNILHFGRICDNIDIQESRFRQTVADYQSVVLKAVKEVEDSLRQFYGYHVQRKNLALAAESDARATALSLDRYRAGKASFQRVLDSQRQWLADEQKRIEANAGALIQLVRLYRALGGGWPGRAAFGEGNEMSSVAGVGDALGLIEDVGSPGYPLGQGVNLAPMEAGLLSFDYPRSSQPNDMNQTDQASPRKPEKESSPTASGRQLPITKGDERSGSEFDLPNTKDQSSLDFFAPRWSDARPVQTKTLGQIRAAQLAVEAKRRQRVTQDRHPLVAQRNALPGASGRLKKGGSPLPGQHNQLPTFWKPSKPRSGEAPSLLTPNNVASRLIDVPDAVQAPARTVSYGSLLDPALHAAQSPTEATRDRSPIPSNSKGIAQQHRSSAATEWSSQLIRTDRSNRR